MFPLVETLSQYFDKAVDEAISQYEKKMGGTAFEDVVTEQLSLMGCSVVERVTGRGTDIWTICDDELYGIEAKKTRAYVKEGDSIRKGRFVLHDKVYPKDCYAFGVEDQIDGLLRIYLTDAEDPDRFIMESKGKRPKYPIERLEENFDGMRCFPDLGVISLPRGVITGLME